MTPRSMILAVAIGIGSLPPGAWSLPPDGLVTVRVVDSEGRDTPELATPLPCPSELDPYLAAAYTDLCLAIFNSNEFLYVD